MMKSLLSLACLVSLLWASVLVGCSKPVPPTLTPKEAKVTSVDLAGMDLRVTMDAHNPNGIDLAVRSVKARLLLDGKHDLGEVTVTQPMTLPAGARTEVVVPISIKWKDASLIGAFAASQRAVPYTVEGTANVGGERLNIDVPFKLQGVVTQEQLAAAALKSLKGLPAIPGLTAPLK